MAKLSIDMKLNLIEFFIPTKLDKVEVEEKIREHERLCLYTDEDWNTKLDVDPIEYIALVKGSDWVKFGRGKHCGGYSQKYEDIWNEAYKSGKGALKTIFTNQKKIGLATINCHTQLYATMAKKGFNHKSTDAYKVVSQVSFLFHKFMIFSIFDIKNKENPFDPIYDLLLMGYSVKRLENKWVVGYVPPSYPVVNTV